METYSPAAMDNAPASRPAMPVVTRPCDETPAPATPRIRLALDTSPSFTPKTAARRFPPDTRLWRCPISSTEVGMAWPGNGAPLGMGAAS